MSASLVCVAIVRGARVYVRPQVEPDGGFALLSGTAMTHSADALALHESCREIDAAWLDAAVKGEDDGTPRYINVLGVTLIPQTLAELIEAAGMIVRTELLKSHPVRLGVFANCALVVADDDAMFSLMGIPSAADETARVFEAVTASAPKLSVVKGGAA